MGQWQVPECNSIFNGRLHNHHFHLLPNTEDVSNIMDAGPCYFANVK